MRKLYHFSASPFSRRTRLALAHKGLEFELHEGRENPAALADARKLVAVKTLPVLVDGALALADSTAITRWLDAAYPYAPRIWPEGDHAFAVLEVTSLVDVALTALIDLGVTFFPLHEHGAWNRVKTEAIERAQRALDGLGLRIAGLDRATIAKTGWSAGDMWLVTAVDWLMGLPGRVGTSQNAAQIMAVGGWTVPEPLVRWAAGNRDRADVRALA